MRFRLLLPLALLLAGCPGAATKAPVREKVVKAPSQGTFVATPRPAGSAVTRDPSQPTLPTDATGLFPTKPEAPAPAVPALTITTLAGSGAAGFADGAGVAAMFARPTSLAVMADGSLVVADHDNNRIRRVAADGTVTTLAGGPVAGATDGAALDARFNGPLGVATAPDGRIFVADAGNRSVRMIKDGAVTTLAKAAGQLPTGLAFDGRGGVFLTDALDNHVRRLDLASGQLAVLAGNGDFSVHDGKGTAASFNSPQGVAVDDQGNAYVGDAGNRRVRKVTPDGTVTSVQLGPVGGNVPFQPSGVGRLADGTLVVSDVGNNRVLAIPPAAKDQTPATLELATGLATPQGLAVGADGTIYVADTGKHQVRKLAGGVPKRP
ncbi:MAG: Serine/threonine-protein kinase PknD [Cyanobacteria bacterium RYN_339]|nr:Serine/threonine-protein kinase PknD [Cyanobacteria bacterium RYN_339]